MAQHDYVLSNQSGNSFRLDLNNALAAIVSQNSGAVEPAVTYAYMFWPDTTTGLLKQRNSANSAWITIGQLGTANLGLIPAGTASIVNADVNASAGIVASKLSFTQSGTGATARTIDSRLKDVVSVKDFGAGTTSNDVAAFVAASQAPGNPTVYVPSGSYTFATTPALELDSVFIFDRDATIAGPGKWPTSAKRIHYGQCFSFVREVAGGIYFYLDNNAAINVRPSITSIGISSAQQTSDITYGLGTGSGAISFGSFIHNNNQTSDTTAWPFYSTVLHENDLGISHCMEMDIFNKGAIVELTPYRPFKNGLTNGLWVAAGGEYTFQSTVQPELGISSAAIVIISNDGRPTKTACWDKGILFHSKSIRGVDGFESTGGNGCAIGFANRHFMKWFRNTDDAVIAEIGSTSNGVQPTRVTFTDLGLLVTSMANGNVPLAIENPATATTGIQIAPNAGGGATPMVLARGVADNIDLWLEPKGAGYIRLGNVVATPVTNNGYITIRDRAGNLVKLMTAA